MLTVFDVVFTHVQCAPRPTSDVDIFVFPADPRHLPARVESALGKSKA